MPLEVLEVTNRFMRDPVRILVKRDELTLEGIKQFYIGTSTYTLTHQNTCVITLEKNNRRREGGMEARYSVRFVRDFDHYSGHHILQHEKKGRLAHG